MKLNKYSKEKPGIGWFYFYIKIGSVGASNVIDTNVESVLLHKNYLISR